MRGGGRCSAPPKFKKRVGYGNEATHSRRTRGGGLTIHSSVRQSTHSDDAPAAPSSSCSSSSSRTSQYLRGSGCPSSAFFQPHIRLGNPLPSSVDELRSPLSVCVPAVGQGGAGRSDTQTTRRLIGGDAV